MNRINPFYVFLMFFVFLLFHCSLLAQQYHWKWEQQPIELKGNRVDTAGIILFTIKQKLSSNYIALARVTSKIVRVPRDSNFTDRSVIFYSTDGVHWKEAVMKDNIMLPQRNGVIPDDIVKHDEMSATALFFDQIFQTTDAGVHWQKLNILDFVDSTSTIALHNITSSPQNSNVIAFSAFSLRKSAITTDRVKSLRELYIPQLQSDTSRLRYYFADDTTLVCIRDMLGYDNVFTSTIKKNRTALFRSTDQGVTWTSLGCPLEGLENAGDSISIVGKIHFANTTTGYLTCMTFDTAYSHTVWVYKTTNGGVSWKVALKEKYLPNTIDSVSSDYRLKIARVFGPDTVIAVTDRGLVRATFNGGKTWKYIVSEKPKDLSVTNDFGINTEGLHFVFETPFKAFAGVRTGDEWGKYNYGFMHLEDVSTEVKEDTAHSTLNVVYANVWLESVSPQPANDGISVKAYYLSETGDLPQARLYNVMGDMVADYSSEIQQQYPTGWFTIRLSTQGLSSGVYFLQLGNRTERRSIPVSVVR